MAINMVKLPTPKQDLVLRVAKGHFATSHSHINYYIDVTMQKTRLSEARAVALELVSSYTHTTIVDTILCLDGTEVIGASAGQRVDPRRLCKHERPPDHLCGHAGTHHRQPVAVPRKIPPP